MFASSLGTASDLSGGVKTMFHPQESTPVGHNSMGTRVTSPTFKGHCRPWAFSQDQSGGVVFFQDFSGDGGRATGVSI